MLKSYFLETLKSVLDSSILHYYYQPRNCKRISDNTFKKRYANHKRSFNINRYKDDMELSVEYWNLKAVNLQP